MKMRTFLDGGGNAAFRTGHFDTISMARLGVADQLEPWRRLVQAHHATLGGDHG